MSISGPEIAGRTLSGIVTVSPGRWSIAQSSQTPLYLTPSSGWAAGDWGYFIRHPGAFVTTTVSRGPWKGTTYVNWTNEVTALYLHPDFLGNVLAPTYSTTQTAAILRQYCPTGAAGLGTRASLNEVNGACGTSGSYSGWHGTTLAHERRHEAKYNQCVVSTTVRNLLDEIQQASDTAELQEFVTRLNTFIDNGTMGPMAREESAGDLWHFRELNGWILNRPSSDAHGGRPCS
ncbi:hypothetical protein [Candidatus Palauibacter sp.]|uniref:hypothetical protein n=1 Tax=Candidatus Palauibacter sp. TaxID=3101350 RepID=UPI003B02AF90